MHVYRYQYKNYNRSHDKRKKRRRILPVTILIVAAAVILSGGVRLDPENWVFAGGGDRGIFPAAGFAGRRRGRRSLRLRTGFSRTFFAPGREWCICRLSDAQVESDWSYEAILAQEAADENYVDAATGKSS